MFNIASYQLTELVISHRSECHVITGQLHGVEEIVFLDVNTSFDVFSFLVLRVDIVDLLVNSRSFNVKV